MPKKKPAATAVDPTLPNVTIDLDGKSFRLCFDFAALAIAERRMEEAGIPINMLGAMDLRQLGAQRLGAVFFASLVRYQPEITYGQVTEFLTMESFPRVYGAVVDAYVQSCAPKIAKEETKEPDPTSGATAEQSPTG